MATRWLPTGCASSNRRAFTLVEMLVAMSLTLVMMAAVIAAFSTIADSVNSRRASVEMATSMRNARSLLADDLANHTCPAVPPVRFESTHGGIEVIEGPQSDMDPSIWLRDFLDNSSNSPGSDGIPDPVGTGSDALTLDLSVSNLPSSNLYRLPGSNIDVRTNGAVTDGRGLGDWDDVLWLTVRKDHKPFVGRVPTNMKRANNEPHDFVEWGFTAIESPLAEVVWFAVENPVEPDDQPTYYFGEPGFRTVYRRALLIAPWLNPGFNIAGEITGPGVLRVLSDVVEKDMADEAAAALIAFQEEYDISVRMEWDPVVNNGQGRWVIKANTLADLTKRENRFEHQGLAMANVPNVGPALSQRYPYHFVSSGVDIPTNVVDVKVQRGVTDIRPFRHTDGSTVTGNVDQDGKAAARGQYGVGSIEHYSLIGALDSGHEYGARPYVWVPENNPGDFVPPTVRAIVDENGRIVMLTNGLAPLSGRRRGEDVMLTNALAFDLKVYDPHAPLLAEQPFPNASTPEYPGEIIEPGSPAWGAAAYRDFVQAPDASKSPVVSRGAYVDLGYYELYASLSNQTGGPNFANFDATGRANLLSRSQFAYGMSPLSQRAPRVAPGTFQPYRVYDTWSTHYESNGYDDDFDSEIDEGTNGLDDDGVGGVDDPGERETAPPYNTPLRGVQVTLRMYEPDSRQIREVNVNQTFVPK